MHFSHLEGLVENHDFVMVGYRGLDGSVVLDCPEISDAIKFADESPEPTPDILEPTTYKGEFAR